MNGSSTRAALAAVLWLPACPGGGTLLAVDDTAVLAAHNRVRATAQPPPVPALAAFSWSDSAAQVAAGYAVGCRFEHNSARGALGENLALFSDEATTADEVVDLWASEAVDYDLAQDACTAGAECGHYTQLVWRDTTAVGCALAACDVAGFGEGVLWVCDYDPAGNFEGERPY